MKFSVLLRFPGISVVAMPDSVDINSVTDSDIPPVEVAIPDTVSVTVSVIPADADASDSVLPVTDSVDIIDSVASLAAVEFAETIPFVLPVTVCSDTENSAKLAVADTVASLAPDCVVAPLTSLPVDSEPVKLSVPVVIIMVDAPSDDTSVAPVSTACVITAVSIAADVPSELAELVASLTALDDDADSDDATVVASSVSPF